MKYQNIAVRLYPPSGFSAESSGVGDDTINQYPVEVTPISNEKVFMLHKSFKVRTTVVASWFFWIRMRETLLVFIRNPADSLKMQIQKRKSGWEGIRNTHENGCMQHPDFPLRVRRNCPTETRWAITAGRLKEITNRYLKSWIPGRHRASADAGRSIVRWRDEGTL